MTSPNAKPRFEDLTETTGIPLTPEAAVMMYTRYHVAAGLAGGRRVLELGCGAGQGFGLIGREAKSLVGGDFSNALLRLGRRNYGARVPLVRLSGDQLPLKPRSFDLVLFFEATYYVPNMENAFDEIARVLAPGGIVLFVNANPERKDFVRSPHSVRYHTATEFRDALERRGFTVTTEGAFAVEASAEGLGAHLVGVAVSTARRVLQALGLVPSTLRGRARLKRILYGRSLRPVPAELPAGFAPVATRSVVPAGPIRGFKVIYVRATRAAP